MALEPKRTVAELEELRELTGDENGAQRVAWTDTWESAREWLRGKVAETGAVEEVDEAGNQWFTLAGDSERALLLGSHCAPCEGLLGNYSMWKTDDAMKALQQCVADKCMKGP